MDAASEAVDGYPFIADWNTDINLVVVGVQTITQDQDHGRHNRTPPTGQEGQAE